MNKYLRYYIIFKLITNSWMTSFCTYTVFGNSVKLCVIENSLGQEVMSDKTNRMIEKRHFYSSKASFLTQR